MTTYPKQVTLFEVGPRDGLQNEALTIATETKLAFIQQLAAAGLTQIEVGSFVSPKWVPQMADTADLLKQVQQHASSTATYSVLTPNQKGLQNALEAGATQIAVFTAASTTFTQKNINKTVEQSLAEYEAMMSTAQAAGIKVRGYVSTCFVCPYEGLITPQQVVPVIKALLAMGCYEVSIGDTIGAAVPPMIEALLLACQAENIDVTQLALHCHDTYGTALANIVKGLEMGITTIDSSAGGLGGCPYAPGASGNVATEDVVYLLDTMGITTGVNLEAVANASHLMERTLGKLLPSKQLQRLKTQQNACLN